MYYQAFEVKCFLFSVGSAEGSYSQAFFLVRFCWFYLCAALPSGVRTYGGAFPSPLSSEFLGPYFSTLPVGRTSNWGPGLCCAEFPSPLSSDLGPVLPLTCGLVPPAFPAPVLEARAVHASSSDTGSEREPLAGARGKVHAGCACLFISAWPRVPGSMFQFVDPFTYLWEVHLVKQLTATFITRKYLVRM